MVHCVIILNLILIFKWIKSRVQTDWLNAFLNIKTHSFPYVENENNRRGVVKLYFWNVFLPGLGYRCVVGPLPLPVQVFLSPPTPEKISTALLEIPPNSWPNEAFSLTSKARAFLIRGTQYPLSLWPGSEISQVMGGTADTRSFPPPSDALRQTEGEVKREMLIWNVVTEE